MTDQTMDIPAQFDLTGEVAVVTGASRGIGRAIAIGLGAAGATVVPTARTTEDIEDTADTIEAAGGTGLAITADVGEEESI